MLGLAFPFLVRIARVVVQPGEASHDFLSCTWDFLFVFDAPRFLVPVSLAGMDVFSLRSFHVLNFGFPGTAV